ncbi:MAG: DMT family transporter [Bacteroidales bacterium]
MNNRAKAIIFALLSVLCWSTVAPAFKLALNEISVLQVLTIASGVASVILLIILAFRNQLKEIKKLSRQDILWSLCFALINPIIYYLILFTAYDRLPAQIAQPLNYTWPVMLSLLAIPFLKQKLPWRALLALLVSFGGVVIISLQKDSTTELDTDALGVFLALVSSIAWAAYWLLQCKSRLDKSLQLFLNFSISFIILCSICAVTGQDIPMSAEAWIQSIWIGIFEMGITFFFWMTAMQYAEKTHIISNLAFLSPFISLFFINLVLKEHITVYTVAGLTLIVTGILLQRHFSKIKL